MTTHEFNNPATQRGKREVLRNDTYFARQSHAVDDAGGRYAKLTPTNVTGSTPAPSYPKQPANSPWSFDPVPATEPLGFSVDAMEPVGTSVEIEKSVRSDRSSSAIASPSIEQGDDGLSTFSKDEAVIGSSIKRRGY